MSDLDPFLVPLPRAQATVLGDRLDVDALEPGLARLSIGGAEIPPGALGSLTNLQHLAIGGGTREVLDLSGCAALRSLDVSHVRGLRELRGLDSLTALEHLSITSGTQITALPSLRALTRLHTVVLHSMGRLATLAPVLDAPSLVRLMLINAVGIGAGDPERMRDHQSLRRLWWWNEEQVPVGVWREVTQIAGLPQEEPDAETLAAPKVIPSPPDLDASAPPGLAWQVTARSGRFAGSVRHLHALGDVLLDDHRDVGSTFDEIELVLSLDESEADAVNRSTLPLIQQHLAMRATLPRVRMLRARRRLIIEVPSAIAARDLLPVSNDPVGVFRTAASEAVAALELLRARLKPGDDLDLDALAAQARAAAARIPETEPELDALVDRVQAEDRDRRSAAQSAQTRRTAPGGVFPGWHPAPRTSRRA